MKKLLCTALLIFVVCTVSYAKRPNPKKIEFEVGLNHTLAAAHSWADDITYKFGFYFEGRYNLKNIPINVGVQGNASFMRRQNFMRLEEPYLSINYNTFNALLLGDYSFRRGKKVNPYAGLGLGVAFHKKIDWNSKDTYKSNDSASFIAAPRIGVKFFNRFNVGFDYTFGRKEITRGHIRIGYYF